MEKHSYNILLLSDLSKAGEAALKSTVAMAKIIHADIHLFFVQKPIDIIEKDNQLSAQRTINETHFNTKKDIETFIAPYIANYKVNISFSFAYGNVKNEVSDTIKSQKPDIIVLGKRKSKVLKFVGDKLANFILKTYKGPVIIASSTHGLDPEAKISLGVLNDGLESKLNIDFVDALIEKSQKPLKLFNTSKTSGKLKTNRTYHDLEKVEFVFEEGSNTLDALNKYVSINKINLLYIDRGQNNKNLKAITSDITSVLNKMDISLLVSSYQ